MYFQLKPLVSVPYDIDEYAVVNIHLSCDNYEPDLMEKDPDGVYRVVRMVPPESIKYYFSIDGKATIANE